jgi:hypothetical protein
MDDLDFQLNDVVVFELPTFEDVEAFCDRLRPQFPGWSRADEQVWLFAADLGTGQGDLTSLLREAQELLSELALPVIRFCLDGRVYLLEAARHPEPDQAHAYSRGG